MSFLLEAGADKENILPLDISEMPMRYSAFQAQNNPPAVVTSSETTESRPNTTSTASSGPGRETPPALTDTNTKTMEDIAVASTDSNLSGNNTDNRTEQGAGGDSDSSGSAEEGRKEAAAIEKVRASISALLFGE